MNRMYNTKEKRWRVNISKQTGKALRFLIQVWNRTADTIVKLAGVNERFFKNWCGLWFSTPLCKYDVRCKYAN